MRKHLPRLLLLLLLAALLYFALRNAPLTEICQPCANCVCGKSPR